MSTHYSSMLVYGWLGTKASIGEALSGFAYKHNLSEEDVGTEWLANEIESSFSNHFNNNVKENDFNVYISLIQGTDTHEYGEHFFGMGCKEFYENSERMTDIINMMKEAFDKAMEGASHPEAKFFTVVDWF